MKLYTAVVKEIQEQRKFSAYQITEGLRKKVNDKIIELDDVDLVEHPTTLEMVANVEHQKVNEIVKDIYDAQIVPLLRSYGSGYYLYEVDDGVVITTSPAIPKGVTWMPSLNPAPAQTKFHAYGNSTKPVPSNLEDKVKNYVEAKKKINSAATLRGIHSSLKTKGVRVVDISSICGKIGYSLDTKTPYYKSEVK